MSSDSNVQVAECPSGGVSEWQNVKVAECPNPELRTRNNNRIAYLSMGDKNIHNAYKCLRLADCASSEGDYEKAERFLLKSERFHSTTLAKVMLKDVRAAKGNDTNSRGSTGGSEDTDQSNDGGYNSESSNTTLQTGEYNLTDKDKKSSVSCFLIVKGAISKGNFKKAERFLHLSIKLYPNETAKEILENLDDLKKNYSSTSYNSTNSSLGNKDEAEKCVQIAETAFGASRLARAEYWLQKAERLYSTIRAKDLLRQIEESRANGVKDSDEGKPQKPRQSCQKNETIRENQENERPRRKEPTSEQIEAIRRVNEARDDFDMLGLSKQSSLADVKKAFRKMTLLLHPDKNKAPGAKEAFMAVSEATERLKKKVAAK